MRKYKRITPTERDKIAVWKAEGVSNKECARRLGRGASTIGREIRRNRWKGEYYVTIHAQGKADQRESKKAHSKQELKNPDVFKYVTDKLRTGLSPDQIAGRLEVEHPGDRYWRITAETIYRWIYKEKQIKCDQPWYEYLRRKQKRRKKYKGRKAHRLGIPDRVSIHKRPKAIDKRKEFGHWEGDTVEGRRHKDGIHTEVERMSRKILGKKIKQISSKVTIEVQKGMFAQLPKAARKSTTLDNGKETHKHYELRTELGMNTYHCDPYSSWQRGTNEHGNWHIRYYYPKGTDFNNVSEEDLQEVIEEINNRPRKILGYLSANEMYQKLLRKEQGVALDS
jgi:transposase, IS30 family